MWDVLFWIAEIFSPFNWWLWWTAGDAADLDDDWRRWLFGALMLVAIVALFVGFCYLATFILPRHGT